MDPSHGVHYSDFEYVGNFPERMERRSAKNVDNNYYWDLNHPRFCYSGGIWKCIASKLKQ
jgi:hypothetical protein